MGHGSARCEVHGDWLLLRTPFDFELKEALKAIPGAMWRPKDRGWWFPAFRWSEVEDVLDRFDLLRPTPSTGRPCRPLGEALAEAYLGVPEPLRKPLARAVLNVLHPDHGGDAAAAREAIDAMKRAS